MKRRAMIAVAVAIRAAFGLLAAAAVIHPDHPVRLAVVAILAAVATGAAVRVQEALR